MSDAVNVAPASGLGEERGPAVACSSVGKALALVDYSTFYCTGFTFHFRIFDPLTDLVLTVV